MSNLKINIRFVYWYLQVSFSNQVSIHRGGYATNNKSWAWSRPVGIYSFRPFMKDPNRIVN
jgi:hypothetical protein